MKKKIVNIFWFALGPLGTAFINFITIPVLTWLINPEELGKTSMFILFQSLAVSIIYLGMDHSYTREYNSELNKRKLFHSVMLLPIGISLIFSILLIAIGGYLYFFNQNSEESLILILFASWLPFVVFERFLLLEIRMKGEGKKYSIYTILSKLSILILTILLLAFSRDYIMILIAMVVGQIIIDIVLILENKSSIRGFSWYLDKDETKKMLHFGLPIMISSVVIWLLNSTDRLLLEHLSDYKQLGIYFAATKITAVILIVHTVFQTIWVPIAYRWHSDNITGDKFDTINRLLYFSLSILFCIIITLKEYIILVLSSEYLDAMYLIPFLLLSPIMYSLSEATGIGISFSRKTNYNLIICIITAVFNIIINWILISRYGAIGASIGTGLSFVLFFWLKTIFSRKLWYKFKVNYYVIMTSILVLSSTVNLIVRNKEIYLINIGFILIICLFNYKQVKEILVLIMNRIKK